MGMVFAVSRASAHILFTMATLAANNSGGHSLIGDASYGLKFPREKRTVFSDAELERLATLKGKEKKIYVKYLKLKYRGK